MDLFTYLMAKNGNNTSVHGDLFSYLLGKAQGGGGQIKTASGITIYIPDATKTGIVSFMMTKESTQDGEPTPDNPVPVNVVEGYRNLFDKDNANILDGYYVASTIASTTGAKTLYVPCNANTTYTIQKISSARFVVATTNSTPIPNISVYNRTQDNTATKITITTNSTAQYLVVFYYLSSADTLTEQEILDSIQIVEGDQEKPYVPYGNNYVNVAVSDGTNTNKYPIPLNNNIIVGIGDYKDELIVDKSGNVFINKKTEKIILNGTENWSRANASDGYRFLCSIIRDKVKIPASTSTIADILCDRFISESANDTNSSINGMGIASSGNIVIYYDVIKNYTTTQIKEWYTLNNTEVYYALETPELIDLQTTVDLKLFKGVNNISNSEDGYMTIEYR